VISANVNFEGGERKVVAMYRQDKNPPYFDWFDGALVWKGKL
jgi:hypothetical protein